LETNEKEKDKHYLAVLVEFVGLWGDFTAQTSENRKTNLAHAAHNISVNQQRLSKLWFDWLPSKSRHQKSSRGSERDVDEPNCHIQ
jgi:hypothetical protein